LTGTTRDHELHLETLGRYPEAASKIVEAVVWWGSDDGLKSELGRGRS